MKVFGIEIGSPATLHQPCEEKLRESYKEQRENLNRLADKQQQHFGELSASIEGETQAFMAGRDSLIRFSDQQRESSESQIRLLTDRITALEEQNAALLEQLQQQRENSSDRETKLMDRLLILTAPNPAVAQAAAAMAGLTGSVGPRPNLPREHKPPVPFRGMPGQRQRPTPPGIPVAEGRATLTPESVAESAAAARAPVEEQVAVKGPAEAELERALEAAEDVVEQTARMGDVAAKHNLK